MLEKQAAMSAEGSSLHCRLLFLFVVERERMNSLHKFRNLLPVVTKVADVRGVRDGRKYDFDLRRSKVVFVVILAVSDVRRVGLKVTADGINLSDYGEYGGHDIVILRVRLQDHDLRVLVSVAEADIF